MGKSRNYRSLNSTRRRGHCLAFDMAKCNLKPSDKTIKMNENNIGVFLKFDIGPSENRHGNCTYNNMGHCNFLNSTCDTVDPLKGPKGVRLAGWAGHMQGLAVLAAGGRQAGRRTVEG